MADTPKQEIKLFYCYARKDKSLRDELEIHLSWLKRHYQLTNWHDREILPGEEWEQVIDRHLDTANLILLLISPDFMASDYCYGKEMRRAIDRHKEGTCRVVPILLRPTFWEEAPFSSLQLLPTDARPITSWSNQDEAFQNVATEINRTIKDLLVSLYTKEIPQNNVTTLNQAVKPSFISKAPQNALTAIGQALKVPSFNVSIVPRTKEDLLEEGKALDFAKRYKRAIDVYDRAIRLDPNYAIAYNNKGLTLHRLKRYEEAIATYNQAIRLDPNFVYPYFNKGNVLRLLGRDKEAITAYDQAIRLDPNDADAYNNMGIALKNLNRHEEAERAFEKVRQLGYRR